MNFRYITFLLLIMSGICISCDKKMDSINADDSETEISYTKKPDHIIVVMLENHNYDSIIDNLKASYINSLADKGTVFTNFHGITHPSYPNYIALFAGKTEGVTSDSCLNKSFSDANLFSKLKSVSKTFAWYSEGLPQDGSNVCFYNLYVRRHNPTTLFSNVPAQANKMFSEFPTDYSKLENVVFITPNLNHDMHSASIFAGDLWIKNNLGALADWCMNHNSIFIINFDEDDGTVNNRIPVVACGQNVKVGFNNYSYNHYSLTKTICALFGADTDWTAELKNSTAIKNWLK